MAEVLNPTPPSIAAFGIGLNLSPHLRRYDNDASYDGSNQGTPAPFAKGPIVSDSEMLVPTTASLYDPSSASLSDTVGRAFAPYYDTLQRNLRGLLHRKPPRIYTELPTAEEIEKYSYVAPPTPLTWQHYAAAGLATTALATGCTTGSDLADTIVKAVGLNLVGGLGLFLYGMKRMSDGVKASSGETLKTVIGRLAGNRFSALAVGTGVTSVIQSSSVTSVLTLGLVNAGVMNLAQALGVIAGANIGTTMTAWLMSTSLTKYGLAMLGAGALTYLFSNKTRTKEIAKSVMGLGMVFHGLKVMSAGFKSPEITTRLTDFFSRMNDPSVGGLGLCMLAGAGVTALIQSSSATVGICIALAAKGIIPFEAAAGIAIGANIGTTITAWLATPGSTRDAKRAALFHTGFNVGGTLLVLPWSPQFASMAKNLALDLGITSPAKQVAFVHTLFNVGAAALFLPFVTQIKNGIIRLVPEKAHGQMGPIEEWENRLNPRLIKTPGAALLAAQEMIHGEMIPRTLSTFEDLASVLRQRTDPKNISETVHLRERQMDQFWKIGYRFFLKLEAARLVRENVNSLSKLWGIGSEIERISDCLEKIADETVHVHGSKRKTPISTITDIHTQVMDHFNSVMDAVLIDDHTMFDKAVVHNNMLKKMVDTQLEETPVFDDPSKAMAYGKIMHEYRALLGHLKNICEFIAGKK